MNTLKRYLGADIAFCRAQMLKEWLSNKDNVDKLVVWVVLAITVLSLNTGGR